MEESMRMHVVIFPWLAFGHLLPGLDLAGRLASRGHRVSFVSTPRNLARLPHVPNVDLVALPTLPRVEGLPDGAESTNDVPFHAFELHRKAFDGLAAPFAVFLDAACAQGRDGRPDWLVLDNFQHWAAAAAAERKVPCALLIHFPASNLARFPTQQPQSDDHDNDAGKQAAAAPRFETERNKMMCNTADASGISVLQRVLLTRQCCSLIGIRTCAELEPQALSRLRALYGIPIVPFGLLPRSPPPDADADRGSSVMTWLDAQPAETVVYVALGSEAPLSVELVHELALGLELAGTRFLWALRKPIGVQDDAADILPPGFEERTRGRGLVAMGWVPQISILANAAVGAFLTHCGWNSTLEGLQFGHPLVMLPIYGDQGANARLMEAYNVGVQVPRDEDDGSFGRDGVASAVRAVMLLEQDRRVFVANANKLQEIVADKELQERCIDEFILALRSSSSH